MTHVSESLAGRLSLVELTPFLMIELGDRPLDSMWLRGGYPDGGVLNARAYPQWQRDYLTLLTRRDLPNWGLSASPQTTERLLKMIRAVHGEMWNASQIGQSLGLSYHTANGYLDYLEGAFLVRRLPPYHANIRKRTIKTPKIYWRDSGLLHAQMNVEDETALLQQPWVGASWEGFVIEQVIGTLASLGVDFEAFHFRTSDRHEVDLVIRLPRDVMAIEVKLTTSPGPGDMDSFGKAADLIKASRRYLVSKTPRTAGDDRRASCNLPWLLDRLQEWTAQ